MTRNLAATLLAALVAFGAWAATETVDGIAWTYRVVDGKSEIYNNGSAAISTTTSGAITIPSTLGGKPVTSIGEYAFDSCRGLSSVTIPNSVTSIGNYAFYECDGLTSVIMPRIKGSKYGLSVFARCSPNLVIRYWDEMKFRLALKPNLAKCGTVSGEGTYATASKVTIKTKANMGYVFAGWFTDKACTKALNPKGYDNRKPTVKVVMPAKNTTIYAKFVTKDGDKSALKFKSATKKLAKTPAKATAGEAFSLKLGVSSASLPTFTAKGLPKGLSIDKTTGEITGVGTVPGSYTATVTVKSAAGNKITQKVKITVNVPSWAKGTFYGIAGIKSEGTWAYVKFSVGATGKVTGKVTYKGKGYSFTSAYKSCTATKATFAPKAKVGSYTLKPGTATVKKRTMNGLTTTEALASGGGGFYAQKKPNLVKKGKPLAALVGETFKFTKKDANSGLTKSKDKLEVKLGNGDAATVSGTVKGKALKALSWAVLASDKETVDGVTTYTLYVDIVDAALKYAKILVITATVGPDGATADSEFAE